MVDPGTLALASVANLALTEGVKFLYAQAGELLKWWRQRRDAAHDDAAKEQPVRVEPPPAIQGKAFEARPSVVAVERLEKDLRALRADLLEYVDGTEVADVSDPAYLARVDALRRALEVIYQHRLTFVGEVRPPSEPSIDVDMAAESVAGYITAVRSHQMAGGSIDARMRVGRVEPGGSVVGVEADVIGDPTRRAT